MARAISFDPKTIISEQSTNRGEEKGKRLRDVLDAFSEMVLSLDLYFFQGSYLAKFDSYKAGVKIKMTNKAQSSKKCLWVKKRKRKTRMRAK